MRGSWAVRLVREFIDTPIPGRIMPPMYCLFSFTTQMVVAVPISIRMSGTGYRLIPATAPTIRSVPTEDGLSISTSRPIFISTLTTRASCPVTLRIASRIRDVTGGTTEPMIAPVISLTLISRSSSTIFREIA